MLSSDYISANSLKRGFQQLGWVSLVLGGILLGMSLAIVFILSGNPIPFRWRFNLVLLYATPALLYAFFVYFVGSRYIGIRLKTRFIATIILAWVLLVIPLLYVPALGLLPDPPPVLLAIASIVFTATAVVTLIKIIYDVMVGAWKESTVITRHRLEYRHSRNRVAMYSDIGVISAFQKSLSCPELDAQKSAHVLDKWLERKTLEEYTVLDIGGGDGLYTKCVLQGLQSLASKITKITMVDPAPWEEVYESNLATIFGKEKVEIIREGFADFNIRTDETFNIILASHSLYFLGDREGWESEAVRRITNRIAPGGIMIVLLSSEMSRANEFKRDVLMEYQLNTTGTESRAAEEFQRAMVGSISSATAIDNVIDLHKPLAAYDSDGHEAFANWLSYFLRLQLTSSEVQDLRVLIEAYTLQAGMLCESLMDKLKKLRHLDVREDHLVLPHKVKLFSLERI
jgi:hypothetical protein